MLADNSCLHHPPMACPLRHIGFRNLQEKNTLKYLKHYQLEWFSVQGVWECGSVHAQLAFISYQDQLFP